METMLIKAVLVKVGDRLDLEGDPYADNPKGGTPDHLNSFEFEMAEVTEVEQETPDCVRIGGPGFCVGFPRDHMLKVGIVKAADIEQPDDIVFDLWGRNKRYSWVRLDPAKAPYGAVWGLKGPHGSAFIIWDHGAYHYPTITACGLWSGCYPESLKSVARELESIVKNDNNRDSDDRITKAVFDSWRAGE